MVVNLVLNDSGLVNDGYRLVFRNVCKVDANNACIVILAALADNRLVADDGGADDVSLEITAARDRSAVGLECESTVVKDVVNNDSIGL